MKKTFKLYIYIIILSVIAIPLRGAVEPARHVSLPISDMARVITFDEEGYLWIGTTSGLLRYDGYQFMQYRNTIARPTLLSNSNIEALATDGKGYLWIGTDNGITRLDLQTGVTHLYYMSSPLQKKVSCINIMHNGDILAGTERGILRYDNKQDRFFCMKNTSIYTVKSIADDGKGNIFVGTWNQGLLMKSRGSNAFRRVNVKGDNFFCLKFDKKGRLWTASWKDGIKLITSPSSNNPQVKVFEVENSEPTYNIIFDHDGSTLACSRNTIYRIDKSLKMISHQDNTLGTNSYIATNNIGTIALLKKTNGIEFFSTFKSPLRVIDVATNINGTHRGEIDGLATFDGNNFWLLSKTSGISTFNEASNSIVSYSAISQLGTIPVSMKSSSCYSSLIDRNCNLWIGNEYFGATIIRKDGSVTMLNQTNHPFLKESSVCYMAQDAKGRIWIGQKQNVAIINPDGKGSNIQLSKYLKDINSNSEVTHIMQDHDGRIWICTRYNGLLRVEKNHKMTTLNRENGRFVADGAISCAEDKNGNILFITSDGELLRWDNANDRSMKEGEDTTVNEDRFSSLTTDEKGNFWLAATNYVMRLQYTNGSVDIRRFYPTRNGNDIIFLENSVYRFGHILYFGSNDKIVAVDAQRIGRGMTGRTKLALTDISVDGHSYSSLDSIQRIKISKFIPAYTREIHKPYGIRRIELDFANLDFANEEAGRYAYKLVGYNHDWVVVPAGSHSATFENLPSGKYTLHLRCTDNNGQWAEMPYTVTLKVLPPWWATWWAYIVYILLVAAAIYGVIVWYRQRIRTQNKLQIARVFTNITHELLTPISVVSASVEAEKNNVGSETYAVIHNNMSRLTRLIRQILEVDKLNSGKLVLRVSNGNLTEFLQRETENMRPLAEQKNISISFDCQGKAPARCWYDTDKLDKIVYNLLSNAIKYTQEGGAVKLMVNFDSPNSAIITVSDNGTGISKEKMRNLYTRFMDGNYRRMKTMGTGIGLSLTRDLVVLHHGNISCDSEEGKGTTFTVTLPINKTAYSSSEIENIKKNETESIVAETSFVSEGKEEDKDEQNVSNKEYTVLLVEDNADLLNLMSQELSKAYNVLRAANGKQALNVLARSAVDIVVSDVMMPVMDGIELTKTIKGNDDYAMLPVILLTAKVRGEDRNEGYKAGADDYLTKPFSMETLRLRIDNFIANRERIRRKFMKQETFNPAEEHYSDPDTQFMEKCVESVKNNISKEGYGRDQLAADMCMSGSSLYKKLRALTGEGVTGFINSIRLKEACRIMRANPNITVADLYLQVGYNSPSYFHRLFKQEFGVTPTEFMDSIKHKKSGDTDQDVGN